MKKIIHLLVTLFTSVSFAASGTIPTKFNTDTVQFGHNGSVANHNLIYDFGLAGLNPALAVDSATKTLKYNKNFFQIGAGSAANESYAFNIGAGANNPNIRWNSSLSKLQFSNDGTTFKTFNLGSDILSGAATNGQVLTADGSGGTLFAAGSGGGGSKNYLSTVTTTNGTNVGNGNFEAGTTSGWVLGSTTISANGLPTGTPTFGTGSDANLSFSAVTANRLSGTYSGSYNSTTPTVQGNFVSTAPFNIDSQDQAKVLSVKIYYKAISGAAGADFSGTNLNSFGLAVYDVTAGAWVDSLAGNFGLTQGIGAGYATATFQTSFTSTQYRFVLYNAHPTVTAINLVIDDVVVGPNASNPGVIPKSSTKTIYLTGSGAYTVKQGVYQLRVKMVGAGGGGGAGGTGSPTGGASGTDSTFGTASLLSAGGGSGGPYAVAGNGGAGGISSIGASATGTALGGGSGDSGTISSQNSSGGVGGSSALGGAGAGSAPGLGGGSAAANTGGGGGGGSAISPGGAGSGGGSGAYIDAIIPKAYLNANPTINYIVGVGGAGGVGGTSGFAGGRGGDGIIEITEDYLGANVQLSSDTDTRVVSFVATDVSGAAIAANATVQFANVLKDSHSGFSSGRYKIPVSGDYFVSNSLYSTTAFQPTFGIYKSGVLFFTNYGSSTSGATAFSAGVIPCVAGDFIDVRSNTNAAQILSSQAGINTLSINRLSGPAVVAASESVNASYSASSNISLSPTGGANFDVKNYDTHNAVTTGNLAWKFTAPESGKYSVSVTIDISASTSAFAIYKNGILYKYLFRAQNATGYLGNGNLDLDLLTGDYIDLRIDSGSGSTDAAQTANNIYIKRIGN